MRPRPSHLLVATLVVGSSAAAAATLPTGFAETRLVNGLVSPTAMAFTPDGRLFVCEQGGRLRVVKNGSLLPTPFVTLTVNSSGERGLLGVAIDPNFPTNQYVYVYYTATTPAVHNRLSRFTANGDVALAGSEFVLLDLDNLSGATNHNGGAIHFGPDGKLYVAVGENANGSNSQTLANLLGKILRLNANGTIPTDNPFFGTAVGANRTIWALGLRNPFTFAFHRTSQRMFINDVGQNTWEEINDGIVASNYGWPTTEGPTTDPRFRSPLFSYGHGSGTSSGCAITGGAFYDAVTARFPASYHDDYFFADYCNGWIRTFDPANGSVGVFATGISSPVDLKVQPDGSLYYLALGAGSVFRVEFTAGQAPTISTHPADLTVSVGRPATFTVSASGTAPLSYQWQRNGSNIAGATGTSYTLASLQLSDDGALFRCVVSNAFGTATSNAARLTVTPDLPPTATITQPPNGTLYAAGNTIGYAGTGTDPEDGALPPGAFTWQVDFHHDAHTHPFVPPTTGSTSGSFQIPTSGETAATVWYRIYLTVRDSANNTHQVFRDVLPRTVNVRIETVPPGLNVLLDGQPGASPRTFQGVVGIVRNLEAPASQVVDGTTWLFASWSDGGARAHTISTPAADTTYTATYQQAPGEPVAWTRMVGVSASANNLTKTAPTAWGNAGATSTKSLSSGDGYVEFTVSETNTHRMLGLSTTDTNQSWNTIPFAFHLNADGRLQIYEQGAYRGAVGNHATGDVLRVAVEAGRVRYRRNGTLVFTSPVAPTYPLIVDTALYTAGATLTTVVVSGNWIVIPPPPPPPPPAGEAVVWTRTLGVSASGNNLTKTAPTGWGNAGASSTKSLSSGDGYVEFAVSETNTHRMLGLSTLDADQSWNTIAFAFHLNADGRLQIYEQGAYRGAVGNHATGDVLRVAVEAGRIKYRRNGTLVFTSTVTPTYPLTVDTALYTAGATLTTVVVSGNWIAPEPPLPPSGEAVVWTRAVGVSVSGNNLTKTAPTAWGNAGASSTKSLSSGEGYVEFAASETNTHRMLGLSTADTNQSWDTIAFAFHLNADGRLQIYERGSYRGAVGSYFRGDVLRVAVEAGRVKYRRNGTLVFTSTVTPTYPLTVDTALYTSGATLTTVVISGNWTSPTAQAFGCVTTPNGRDPECPREFLKTTLSDTPSPGGTITVPSGGNLQAALDQASLGDTVVLSAGGTYTGNFTLPRKTAGTGWITLRTSNLAGLPAEGHRVFPQHAAALARIVSPNTMSALQAAAGAHHYRLLGLEITTTHATTASTHYNVVSLGSEAAQTPAQLPTWLVIDRCYIHGTPTGNVRRCLGLNSTRTAVIDSYLADCHEVGADSQAIGGWSGPGPFKIVNNYLEGAGENLLFGGADSPAVDWMPADIEIRHNHFRKPLSWRIGHAEYAGIPWGVKNLLELKAAVRVLVEGNVFENNWAHAQNGYGILFTVRNQDGGAPWSAVEDVAFVRNVVRRSEQGFNTHGADDNFPSQPTRRVLISHNLLEGVTGNLFQQIGGAPDSVAYDMVYDHNTALHSETGNAALVLGDVGGLAQRLAFTNNLVTRAQYGVFGSGKGEGTPALDHYLVNYVFTKNGIVGSTNAANYPASNFFPTDPDAVFVRFNGGDGGDYHLPAGSPYRLAGTDGKDLGADVDALLAATACAVSGACGT